MKILLAQNSAYYPAHGGGDKSNRLLMEALAGRGHACRVVARTARFGEGEQGKYLEELAARGVEARCREAGVVAFERAGVEVRVLAGRPNLRAHLTAEIAAFAPEAILTSTDDPAQILLEAALEAGSARVVYLARATLALPFGPDCAFPSAAKTALLARADAVVGVSEYVAGYIRRWGGIGAVHVPISLMEPGPAPELGRFDNEFVTFVNPCAVKGISIFLALAEAMPEVRFAAVPTWGTNAGDRAALAARSNVCVLDPVDRVDELFARTRVLLVPSLWAEARSRIIPEAMLRGIPVVASDAGGIREAMMGLPYLLAVRPIEKYRPSLDEQMVPVAEVPEQDLQPWREALGRLTSERGHWEELSRRSREAALGYAAGLTVEPFERVLEGSGAGGGIVQDRSEACPTGSGLSREKKQLLALRLRRREQSKWFPGIEREAARPRLFCFPHAGGGASAFRGWSEALEGVEVCPARLPGREARWKEAPLATVAELVAAVLEAMAPYAGGPFALYGHSMGAVVAFELARALRAAGGPMPRGLLVSGARAPQYRAGWVAPPAPSEAEFVEQLRKLEGVPREVLDNPELLELLMPALRADTSAYRQWVYTAGAALACPIVAYGGLDDPNVSEEQIEGWGEQTTAGFRARMFAGGHFFVQASRAEFLAALAADAREALR